jgi:hypothetical protein
LLPNGSLVSRRAGPKAALRVMGLLEPWEASDDRRRQVVEINRTLGCSVVDVEYGGSSGYLIEAEDRDLWCRCWLLMVGATEVEVTYTCHRAKAGRDDAAIHQMLYTLTIGGGAA